MDFKKFLVGSSLAILTIAVVGCGNKTAPESEGSGSSASGTANASLSGDIKVDGSSTVLPIMERMAEDFSEVAPNVRVTVAKSGTGGGFKKFINGEIDIANASRPIETEEIEKCKANGVEFIEVPVAFDGLSVVVSKQNDFVTSLTVAELKKIWEPNSKVKMWSDIRPDFPKEAIKLYGAGTDSGTFDYFTKAINGEEKASRSDYNASEDDNSLVQGVQGDKFALGYFGYAYYEQNKDKLTALGIGDAGTAVPPTFESIADGSYQPLSRPLFIYVNKKALDRVEVQEFLKYILTEGNKSLNEVGYVPLPADAYAIIMDHVTKKSTGTRFKGAEIGVKIEDILKRESGN